MSVEFSGSPTKLFEQVIMRLPHPLLVCPIIVASLGVAPAFAQAPTPTPLSATMIVDEAVREVRKHRRSYDEATRQVLSEAEKKLNEEVNRLLQAGQGNLDQALAIRQMIGNLAPTVTKRADAPMPEAVISPPPMEKWVIGKWTGANTPHIIGFSGDGAFEEIGKTADATNVFGAWKSLRQGYIDVDVANGNRWEIRRCGPNAMAVVVSDPQNKQRGDGIVLFRVLDPVVGNWKWFNGAIHELWGDGQVKDRPGAFWKAVDPTARKYLFSWQGGEVVDTLVLSPDGMSLKGTNNKGVQVSAERVR